MGNLKFRQLESDGANGENILCEKPNKTGDFLRDCKVIFQKTSANSLSALSQLNCRVNRFEFRSGIVDLHLPVNATLRGVDIIRPCLRFLTQTGDISEAAVCDALACERTQFIQRCSANCHASACRRTRGVEPGRE